MVRVCGSHPRRSITLPHGVFFSIATSPFLIVFPNPLTGMGKEFSCALSSIAPSFFSFPPPPPQHRILSRDYILDDSHFISSLKPLPAPPFLVSLLTLSQDLALTLFKPLIVSITPQWDFRGDFFTIVIFPPRRVAAQFGREGVWKCCLLRVRLYLL